jgi:signal transduction histidine kinase
MMLAALFGGTLLIVGLWGAHWIAGLLSVVFGMVFWLIARAQHSSEKQRKEIARKLKKRNRQKTKYTKKLKRLTRQQGEIISAISHEFKNPIAAIIGYTQTVYDDPDLPPELRQKFLDKVIRNSQRISDMIDRLALSITFENNTLDLQKEPFDMGILLDEVTDNLRQKYPDRTLRLLRQSITIEADRMLFWQVVSNLLDNALKYSEDDVTVRLLDGRFEVVDHGIGIAPDEVSKVTQRFFRSDARSWDNSMGVGLFIVEYILRLHDTRLEIDTTPGEGSTFGFVLPV